MNNFKTWWNNTDSIEIVLFASLAFCVGWGLYHTDNSEFVNTANEQQEAGATWHWVGWQDHEEGLPAITFDSNGNKHVAWKLKYAEDTRVD
jgi:hypothetical protein